MAPKMPNWLSRTRAACGGITHSVVKVHPVGSRHAGGSGPCVWGTAEDGYGRKWGALETTWTDLSDSGTPDS